MTDPREKTEQPDRIWLQFGEWPLNNIRKWSYEPFEGGVEYNLSAPTSQPIPLPARGWPKPGDRMRFLDENGYPGDLVEARLHFAKGQVAIVRDFRLGDWHSSIAFDGISGHFNSVMFEHVDEEPSHD